MAKKKAKSFLKFGNFVAAALAILAVLTIFLPAVKGQNSDSSLTGLQVAFGYSQEIPLLGSTKVLNFSTFAFLAYLLPICGVVLSLLNRKGTGSFFSFLSAACYIAGAVFLFLLANNLVFSDEAGGLIASTLNWITKLVLTPWSIIGGVVLCLSGLISLANVFLK